MHPHKVWLHIGMPKTGTTAIQETLAAHRPLLREHGTLYPDFGTIQHWPLVRHLARQAGSSIAFPGGGCQHFPARYLDWPALQHEAPRQSIISTENFYQRPACMPGATRPIAQPWTVLQRTIEETARFFAGCSVEVLIWTRRQDRWLASMYNESVKSGQCERDFADFAPTNLGADICRVVRLWIEAFGRPAVHCQGYEPTVADGRDMVSHFLETVSLAPLLPELSRPRSSNPGLGHAALWLKRRINRRLREAHLTPGPAERQQIQQLLRQLNSRHPAPPRLFPDLAAQRALLAPYREGNRQLHHDLGYAGLAYLDDLSDLDGEAPAQPCGLDEASCNDVVDALLNLHWSAPQRPDSGPAGS